MNQSTYPVGTVRALLTTDHVSEKTRDVLLNRLKALPAPLRFFTADEADTLRQIAARLIPQPDQTAAQIDLVSPIDERLANNESDGWRYDVLPHDTEAFRQGLRGFHEAAQAVYGQSFDILPGDQQDNLITQIQHGNAPGATWTQLPSDRFFADMLAELVGIYFSHPLAQEAFGYVGMADKPSWNQIGLNQLEDREPKETR